MICDDIAYSNVMACNQVHIDLGSNYIDLLVWKLTAEFNIKSRVHDALFPALECDGIPMEHSYLSFTEVE